MDTRVAKKGKISGESDDVGALSPIVENSAEISGDDSVSKDFEEYNETRHTSDDSSLKDRREPLYVQARKKLNKVNRVSRSTLPPAPKTPSKSGVIRESGVGKFKDIHAIFERKLFDSNKSSPSTSQPKMKLSQNNIGKKFGNYFTLHKSPRRSLNFLDVDKTETSKFDTKDN